jgi:hypothetical protein
MDKTLGEILAERGLAAGTTEWRVRRAPLADQRERMLSELRSLEQRLLALDEEFAKALQQNQQTDAPPDVASLREVRTRHEVLSSPDLVLAILRENGGQMKSRLLYIEAERHGKQRKTVYVTVSKLISTGVLKKHDLPGERGCILELPDEP